MLRRPKLPPDNYPDDYNTPEYVHYQAHFSPGLFLWLRFRLPRIVFLLFVILAIIGGVLLGLALAPEEDPEIIVVAPTLSLDSLPPIGGAFPTGAAQQVISLPARVDNYLPPGGQQAYRFILQAGILWQIRVSPGGAALSLDLYDANGVLLGQATSPDGFSDATLTHQAGSDGQFAAVVTMNTSSDGTYTIRITPLNE